MGIYSIESQINSLVESNSTLEETVAPTTTYAEYNSIKSQYESNSEEIEALLEQYGYSLESFKIVTQNETPSSDYKDKNEWLAGGYLRNEQLAGGDLYSPDKYNPTVYEPNKATTNNMLNGNYDALFKTGFSSVNYLAMGGVLDLMFTEKKETTRVYKYEVLIYSGDTRLATTSGEFTTSDGNGDSVFDNTSYNNISNTNQANRLSSLAKAWNSKASLQSFLAKDPISIAFYAVDVLTGKSVSFETRLEGLAIGTIYSGFTSAIGGFVAETLGMTAQTPISTQIATGMFLGTLLGEAFEVAVGLDNHFGFGGDFAGVDAYGNAVYDRALSIGEGLTGIIGETLQGILNTVTLNLLDINITTAYDFARNESLQSIYSSYSYGLSDIGMYGQSMNMSYNEMNAIAEAFETGMYASSQMALNNMYSLSYDFSFNDYTSTYNSWDLNNNGYNDSYERAVEKLTGRTFESQLGSFDWGSSEGGSDSAFGASIGEAHESGMQGPGREDGTF